MKTQQGRDLTPEEMAQMLEEFVNSHSYGEDIAQFVDQVVYGTHRTLQQGIMRYMTVLIEKWATLPEDRFDARNEATVKMARKLFAAMGDKYDRHLPTIEARMKNLLEYTIAALDEALYAADRENRNLRNMRDKWMPVIFRVNAETETIGKDKATEWKANQTETMNEIERRNLLRIERLKALRDISQQFLTENRELLDTGLREGYMKDPIATAEEQATACEHQWEPDNCPTEARLVCRLCHAGDYTSNEAVPKADWGAQPRPLCPDMATRHPQSREPMHTNMRDMCWSCSMCNHLIVRANHDLGNLPYGTCGCPDCSVLRKKAA